MTQLLPKSSGIGFRAAHYAEILSARPELGFLEIHPENYLGGGAPRNVLRRACEHYPISFHCVGMSLGSADGIPAAHISSIRALADEVQPAAISDHLSWSMSSNAHLNDLLPLPYTKKNLSIVSDNVEFAQEILGRQLWIENPSTYLEFTGSEMSEPQFIAELAKRTGCGILLDINNVYVSSYNHGFDAMEYIRAIPAQAIKQFHLSGHTERQCEHGWLLVDTHNRNVREEVWALFRQAVLHSGQHPTCVEWDADFPPLEILLSEARKANAILHAKVSEYETAT